jgi:lipoprotein-releasing system permease protein
MKLAWMISSRYLRKSPAQTALMIALVMIGSLVYVFITSLLTGVQRNTVVNTLGTISHITVKPLESVPDTLEIPAAQAVAFRKQRGIAQPDRIADYERIAAEIRKLPNVTAVSPIVSESGFAIKAGQVKPITILGVELSRAIGILDLKQYLKLGEARIEGDGAMIGSELARLLDVTVGDRVRVQSSNGTERTFRILGIFKTGSQSQNERNFYCTVSAAQRLAGIVGFVNNIEVKLDDVFTANERAERIRGLTGIRAVTWTTEFSAIEGTIQQISFTREMIRAFGLLSVAFGITAVLGVAVSQKRKEIGILKGMGTRTGQILAIFFFQGLTLGLIGGTLGSVLGGVLINALINRPVPEGGTRFPAVFAPEFVVQGFVISCLVATLSGLIPARQAAKMDPIEAIRYG